MAGSNTVQLDFWQQLEERSLQVIRENEPDDGYYVAFSGGKDSIVLLDLVRRAGVKHDVHFNVDLSPPELFRFIRQNYPGVEWHYPEVAIFKEVAKRTMPTRVMRWCCQYLKEGGGEGRTVLTGVRWAESNRRAASWKAKNPPRGKSKEIIICPIIDWEDCDVWDYIKAREIPYCSLYDEGFKRLGCVLCPMARNVKVQMARWPKYAAAWKKAAIHRWENSKKCQEHWPSGEAYFEWWLNRDAKLPDKAQEILDL